MTLAGRVSSALLAMLAVALVTAGVGVHWVVRSVLSQRVDQRLDGALDALGALVELEPGGLEWDTENRSVRIGAESDDDEIRWIVVDGEGRRVADSGNLGLLRKATVDDLSTCFATARETRAVDTIESGGSRWRRMCVRRVAPAALPTHTSHAEAPVVHRELVVLSALPLRSLDRALGRLLAWSAGISLAILLAAALLARGLCSHALAPLARMAATADEISAADLRRRLPSPGTRDVLDRLAAAFNDLLGRVEQAYATQRRLAADASHQLRTPLTAQVGQLEVALRRDRPPEEYREALSKALVRAQEMSLIVESLLDLARLETEGGRPQVEDVDLGDWLRAHADTWAAHARRGDFRVRAADEPLTVRASRAWLGQVVDALVDNACKHGAAAGPIEIEARRDGPAAVLEVTDHGVGLSDEDRRRVFEPFFRSADARRSGRAGLGLGLSIAARLADAMDGRIDVRSTPGEGSTFALVLPAAAPAPDAVAAR